VAIVRVGWRFHPSNLAGRDLSGQAEVSVTMPMEVMDAGWLAIIIDPTGATLGLWQAKTS
jgi:hypothetical protein